MRYDLSGFLAKMKELAVIVNNEEETGTDAATSVDVAIGNIPL